VRSSVYRKRGAVAEWFKALVLKTSVSKGTGGSNPSCSVAPRSFFHNLRIVRENAPFCVDTAEEDATIRASLVQMI
jgi:hypothetical protein